MADKRNGSSPLEPDEEVFAFDVGKLRPGDVLLSTVPGSPVSLSIRLGTWSRFSHAAICTEPPLFLEAIGCGVSRFSIAIKAVRNPKWIRVLRIREGTPGAEAIVAKAIAATAFFYARGYWTKGAFAAPFAGLPIQERAEFFCSHLVATAFKEAGLDLVEGREAHKVTPGALAKSPCFINITMEVLRKTTAWEMGLPLELIEQGQPARCAHRETEVKRAVFEQVVDEFTSRGVETPAGFDEALVQLLKLEDERFAELDSLFYAAMVEQGLVFLPEELSGVIADSLVIDVYIEQGIALGVWSRDQLSTMLRTREEILESRKPVIASRRKDIAAFTKIGELTSSLTFTAYARIHEEVLEFTETQERARRRSVELLRAALDA